MAVDAELYSALQQHFTRYFEAVDSYDLDGIMAVLTGATLYMRGTELTGDDAIRDLYATVQPPPLEDGRRQTKHNANNLLVEGPDADGRYTATVYYTRLQPGENGPIVVVTGRLTEVLRPHDDRFAVFTHRVVTDF